MTAYIELTIVVVVIAVIVIDYTVYLINLHDSLHLITKIIYPLFTLDHKVISLLFI